MSTTDTLTPQQARFVEEYLVDLNATQAAVRAGYSAKTASQQGARLLANVKVQEAIAQAKAARAERVQVTQDMVLADLLAVASADPNELIQFRRACCRNCWGDAFRHQETQGERDVRFAQFEKDRLAAAGKPLEAEFGTFDEKGGIGYDGTRSANPDCPECFGLGVGEVHVPDTRTLTGPARRLYAGVKQTKEGLQVMMRSQDKALELIGRHLAMFTDKVELSGKVGLADRLEAARKRAEQGG